MKTKSSLLLWLLISGCLTSCTSLKKNIAFFNSSQIKNNFKSTTNEDSIEADRPVQYYEIGRAYQKNSNFNQAAIAYQKSLLSDPGFTKSITGLATLYADQKLHVVSIPLFEQAVKLMPDAVNYNNLGYAYFLNKEYTKANSALMHAIELKPDYIQAKKNLDLLNDSQSTTAHKYTSEQSIASNLLKPVDSHSKKLTLNSQIESVKLTTVADKSQFFNQDSSNQAIKADSEATIIQTANGLYELNFNNPLVITESINNLTKTGAYSMSKEIMVAISGGITFKHMPAISKLFGETDNVLATFSVSDSNKLVEIINGNGIKGMARAVANKFEVSSNVQTKVADARSFNQMKTHIQYKSGYRDDAVNLNHHLFNRPYLIRNDKLPDNVSLRLVLGKDLLPGFNSATMTNNQNDRFLPS